MWTDEQIIWEWDARERCWRGVVDDVVVTLTGRAGVVVATVGGRERVLGRMCIYEAMREVVRLMREEEEEGNDRYTVAE